MGKGALCLVNGGTAVQILNDKIADGIRIIADDIETLTKVDILDNAIDHQGFRHQAQRGIQSGGRSEYEEGHDHGGDIHHQKRRAREKIQCADGRRTCLLLRSKAGR